MSDNTMPMAWNEPGKGGGKDPWGKGGKGGNSGNSGNGGGNGNDGPPDLDEVFKKFQDKVSAVFRKDNNESGGKSSVGFFVILLILVVLYGASGFFFVKPAEQAVITRFGKYNRTVGEGPKWIPLFIEDKTKVNVQRILSTKHSGNMLTKDENIVSIEIEVQYRISDPMGYLFKVVNADNVLKQAAESALRQIVGHATIDFVMTEGRAETRDQITVLLQEILDSYDAGIQIVKVNLNKSKAPEHVKEAFDDVIRAREELEQLKNNAQAYANKLIPEAEGQAERMRVEANAYKQEMILNATGETQKFDLILPEYIKAPDITRKRLYLDAMEHVLSRTSKVLVDIDGQTGHGNGANSLIYLPIDKMMSSSSSTLARQTDNTGSMSSQLPYRPSTSSSDFDEEQRRRRRG